MENWIESFAVGSIILVYILGIIFIMGVAGFWVGVLFGRYPIVMTGLTLWAGAATILGRYLSK